MLPAYIPLALLAAFGYSACALFSKRAIEEGCSLWRIAVTTVQVAALAFIPLLFTGPGWPEPRLWYQPARSALFLFGGIFFQVLALRSGDVSIVVPVAGIKPVVNALLLTFLLRIRVAPAVWTACALAAVALLIMHSPNVTTRGRFAGTVLLTFCSACLFALCDTCFQSDAPIWGAARFTALTSQLAALASLAFLPRFRTRLRDLPRAGRAHLLAGALFFLLPSFCMGFAIGRYGRAPEINVLYSSRALWSIGLVWGAGRLVGSREHTASRTVLLRRLAGAALLTAAAALVIFGSA